MKYSVYRYSTKTYDVYDDGKPSPTHANSPSIVALSGVGEIPEAAAVALPVGAKKIAESETPVGTIASTGSADLASGLTRLGIYAGLAYVAWRIIR
jgi:hypothetical protein